MLAQAAHQVITLHFVSTMGSEAVAGVSSAANAGVIIGALGQILNVGTAALVAYSAGIKNLPQIERLLNQAFGLGLACAVGTMCVLCGLAPLYMATLSADSAVVDAGVRFLWWVSPGFALSFLMTAISATLRGIGVISVPMLIFALMIILDAAFAIVLIPGNGMIPGLGVTGAALANTLSVAIGTVLMLAYLHRAEPGLAIQRKLLLPKLATWQRIFALGVPAAAELTLTFLSTSVIYFAIRDQGASAQAGFGIASRLIQLLTLPALAFALAAAPIAGQNFGAGNFARVRGAFRSATLFGAMVMLIISLVVQWRPAALLRFFETDNLSAETATSFLQLMSWTLVAQGVVYTCAFMFQALGNTKPALLSATARFVIFSIPATCLSYSAGFNLQQVWYLLAASIVVQAGGSLWLLHVEFKRKLRSAGEIALAFRFTDPTNKTDIGGTLHGPPDIGS
jgi:putative MATE family efflux protein